MDMAHSTYTKLRFYNILMGSVHLLQGLLVVILSTEFVLPVTAYFLDGPPGTPQRIEVLFNLNIGWAVAVFVFLSAFAHYVISLPGVFGWYIHNLSKNRNYSRWIEYAISSSVMMVLIAMLPGISDIVALIGIFFVNAAMVLFGLLMEHYEEPGSPDWLTFIFGCIMGIVPWLGIGIYLWSPTTDAAPPAFVYGIFFSIFIFFNSFAINMFLQYKKIWKWENYLFGESVYIFLSLASKTALVWQVFAGTLVPA